MHMDAPVFFFVFFFRLSKQTNAKANVNYTTINANPAAKTKSLLNCSSSLGGRKTGRLVVTEAGRKAAFFIAEPTVSVGGRRQITI